MPLFSPVSAGVSGIVATGGTTSEVGLYKIHTFSTVGTTSFVVSANPQNQIIEFLIVGGGGGGGQAVNLGAGSGGGSGGIYWGSMIPSVTSYSVVVGAGASASTSGNTPTDGNLSSFGSYTANAGKAGSGGGGGSNSGGWGGMPQYGLVYNVSDNYGRTGGTVGNASFINGAGAITSDISGTSTVYGGGGGAGKNNTGTSHNAGTGSGRGGAGAATTGAGTNGSNYGGGGGGGSTTGSGTWTAGSSGGQGVVIVRYRK